MKARVLHNPGKGATTNAQHSFCGRKWDVLLLSLVTKIPRGCWNGVGFTTDSMVLCHTVWWSWLEAVQGVHLNTVRPEEWILLSGVDVLVPLEETPSVSYLPGEVPCPDDFVRWLCIPVTLVWYWRRDILSLDTKGILETKYRAESGTKLRCSWWSILETNGQWTGFFLLFIFFFLLHLLYRGWNQGTLCMRVTPFSEGKYIFRMLCSNPFQWGKDLLSVLQFKPR